MRNRPSSVGRLRPPFSPAFALENRQSPVAVAHPAPGQLSQSHAQGLLWIEMVRVGPHTSDENSSGPVSLLMEFVPILTSHQRLGHICTCCEYNRPTESRPCFLSCHLLHVSNRTQNPRRYRVGKFHQVREPSPTGLDNYSANRGRSATTLSLVGVAM